MNQSLPSTATPGSAPDFQRPLIGYSSPAVPREILYAAGCRPFFLGNSDAPVSAANEFLEAEFFGPRSYLLFHEISLGSARQFRALILSRTTEQEYKLYLYLRELQRTSRISSSAEIYIFNLLQTAGDRVRAYSLTQIGRLLQAAKAWSGADSGDEALLSAVQDGNLARKTLAEALKLRSHSQRATGCGVVNMVNAYYSLDPLDFCAYAKTWTAEWESQPQLSRPRILLLGDIPSGGLLHALVEAEDAVVSVEDHWLGERAAVQPIDESPGLLAAIAGHSMQCAVTPRHHSRPQSELWLKQMMDRVDAAVFFHGHSDSVEGWDYPWQSRVLTEHQKPFLRLRDLSESSRNTFKAFRERLS